MKLLEFKNVTKVYKRKGHLVEAISDVCFELKEGEVFGFIGPNGAGKSTTIKIILDIVNDYDGEVLIFNKNARSAGSRFYIGYVPEASALYENFTPLDVLKTSLSMHRKLTKDSDKQCMHWLKRFGVERYAKQKIRQLSKGNVQRVSLAHAMVIDPKLLILDEPLSGLDPVGRKEVVDILQEYKANGGAIFFTSHVLHDVERIADRFGFINNGCLLTTQSPKDLMSEHADQFEVRYQSDNISEGRKVRDGEYELKLSQTELPKWLEKLNAIDGRLLEVKPLITLEKVFFKLLEKEK